MNVKPDSQLLELLSDIVLWGDRIPVLLEGMTYEQFAEDHRTHLAVWKCIEIIGEVSGRLLKLRTRHRTGLSRPPDQKCLLNAEPAHAWLRRRCLSILWTTAHNFIPPMVAAARAVFAAKMADLGNP